MALVPTVNVKIRVRKPFAETREQLTCWASEFHGGPTEVHVWGWVDNEAERAVFVARSSYGATTWEVG